ncbi:DivIVA domain-containing protein [Marisediminicola antarctica]|uniref:MFS transporter permease n=1 Tax=Marisediminicola antarctica TaxID=674079 RepID=A0A7L5AKV0_9MICO|nr:DivIVA domain-containing protein [Marisediminicola antarctica]QHO71228.1 MFS transporter permease [Marisediminicola antarctica]
MSTTFPRTTRSHLGYDVEQVEDFLEEARRAYGAEAGQLTIVTAASIRHTAFAMQKGGYETGQVDAALERLEDAFASRERELRIREKGEEEWYSSARTEAQEILDRLARPDGERFDRIRSLTVGYSVQQVDEFAGRLTRYFQDGDHLTVDEVRAVSFAPQRGGYRETQVDVVLDAVIDVMLAVRS